MLPPHDTIDSGLGIKTTALTGVFGVSVSFSPGSSEPNSTDLSNQAAEPARDPSSMGDYYDLVQTLYRITFVLTAIIFGSVWLAYSLGIALNYLLGACVGLVYFRMLAKNVEQLGQTAGGVNKTRMAVVAGVLIVATQWDQLHLLPVFLGFLTYKAALLIYTIRVVSTS